jgi:hypothetical protein
MPFTHSFCLKKINGNKFTPSKTTKTKTMKTTNQTVIANPIIGISYTAKKAIATASKFLALVLIGCTFLLTSCGRNVSSGCGTWASKNNLKYKNERKYNYQLAKMYHTCPKGYCSR